MLRPEAPPLCALHLYYSLAALQALQRARDLARICSLPKIGGTSLQDGGGFQFERVSLRQGAQHDGDVQVRCAGASYNRRHTIEYMHKYNT